MNAATIGFFAAHLAQGAIAAPIAQEPEGLHSISIAPPHMVRVEPLSDHDLQLIVTAGPTSQHFQVATAVSRQQFGVLELSSNAEFLFAGRTDGTTEVFDGKTGQPHKFSAGTGEYSNQLARLSTSVTSIAYAANIRLLAIGHASGEICVWDISTGGLYGRPLRLHRCAVAQLAFQPPSLEMLISCDSQAAVATVQLTDFKLCADPSLYRLEPPGVASPEPESTSTSSELTTFAPDPIAKSPNQDKPKAVPWKKFRDLADNDLIVQTWENPEFYKKPGSKARLPDPLKMISIPGGLETDVLTALPPGTYKYRVQIGRDMEASFTMQLVDTASGKAVYTNRQVTMANQTSAFSLSTTTDCRIRLLGPQRNFGFLYLSIDARFFDAYLNNLIADDKASIASAQERFLTSWHVNVFNVMADDALDASDTLATTVGVSRRQVGSFFADNGQSIPMYRYDVNPVTYIKEIAAMKRRR